MTVLNAEHDDFRMMTNDQCMMSDDYWMEFHGYWTVSDDIRKMIGYYLNGVW